jgi:hypothetical protein
MLPFAFLRLRMYQLLRESKALGWLYSLILLSLVSALLYLAGIYVRKPSGAAAVLAIVSSLLFALHRNRTDHRFVASLTGRPWIIYFTEYAAIVLVLYVSGFLCSGDPVLPLVIFLVPFIAFVKPAEHAAGGNFFAARIPHESNFEWRSGIRKQGWLFPLLWLLSLLLAPVPFAPILLLWFMMLAVSSFYDEGESRSMLESAELPPVAFMRCKISGQLTAWSWISVPSLAVSAVFHPDRWWVLLLFIAFSTLMVSLFVTSKYAVYQPAEINRSNSLVHVMCMLGLFIPFLLPLPLVMLVRNYRKAISNLETHLYDYH